MDLTERLVAALHDNGRLPVSELARRLDLPRHRVDEHLRHLLSSGTMRVVAHVHPAMLDIHQYCHLLVRVDGPCRPVAELLRAMPYVPFVSEITGEHRLALEVGARDPQHLVEVLTRIRRLPGVHSVEASQHLATFKSRFTEGTDLSTVDLPPLDDLDGRIVNFLRRDGRMTYRALSEALGLSIGAVRARLSRLVDSGLLRITPVMQQPDTARSFLMGIGISVRGDTARLSETLRSSTAIEFAALTLGSFDMVVTASASTPRALSTVLEQIGATPGVGRVTSWMHLNVVRESYE